MIQQWIFRSTIIYHQQCSCSCTYALHCITHNKTVEFFPLCTNANDLISNKTMTKCSFFNSLLSYSSRTVLEKPFVPHILFLEGKKQQYVEKTNIKGESMKERFLVLIGRNKKRTFTSFNQLPLAISCFSLDQVFMQKHHFNTKKQ